MNKSNLLSFVRFKPMVSVVMILLLLGAIGITTYQIQFRQDSRSRAEFNAIPLHTITQLFPGTLESEKSFHGKGNVYAPEVLYENGTYKMWYGGQGTDGRDQIHYAESSNGVNWNKLGVVLSNKNPKNINGGKDSNHINDPSIVKVNGTYYMFYTDAYAGEFDKISLATSTDGRTWTKKQTVLRPILNPPYLWTTDRVSRPTVLHENGIFKMWFDTFCIPKTEYNGACDPEKKYYPWPQRHIGYATSSDGYTWSMHPTPVFNGGAIDVVKYADTYFMVHESKIGTYIATSKDGLTWVDRGLWYGKSGKALDQSGHITPFIFISPLENKPTAMFFGAAGSPTGSWDQNSVAVIRLAGTELDQYINFPPQGNFDRANCEVLAGYACDMNTGEGPIQVDIYDGSTFVTSVSTTYDRKSDPFYTGSGGQSSQQIEQQLSKECSPTGNVNKIIGWKIATPNVLKDGKQHTLHAYAINTPAGANKKLTYYYTPTNYASTTPYVITCTATPTPSGQLSASPNPCSIPWNQPGCVSTISWTSTNTPSVTIRVESGTLFASGGSTGSATTGSWIGDAGTTFIMYAANGNELHRLKVNAVRQPSPTPILPTNTPTPLPTRIPPPTNTPTATPTPLASTATPTSTPLPTNTPTAIVTAGPTNTPAPIAGDVNGDKTVNIIDYNIILNNFGKTGATIPGANVTEPLWKVDIYDYNLVLRNYSN